MIWNPLGWVIRAYDEAGLPPPLDIVSHSARINLGQRALRVALMELGRGEGPHNNVGVDLDRWRTSLVTGRMGSRGAWCAAFVSWCYEFAAELNGLPVPTVRSHGAKRLFRNVLAAGGERVTRPQPGDLVCWHRGRRNGRWNWTGHVGLVSGVDGSHFVSAEGNVGPWPAVVSEYKHPLSDPRLVGFARF